jgi:hypothetical protein
MFALCTIWADGADDLAWKFKEGTEPVLYKVKIEHQQKGADSLKVSLWMEWLATLQEVTPKGVGRWALKVERLRVTLDAGDKGGTFDSARKGQLPEIKALRIFAELMGMEVVATVAGSGEIRSLEGGIAGLPMPGNLEIGKDPETALARGLVKEAIARLFRLPKKEHQAYSFGASGTMPGISAYALSLGEEMGARKTEQVLVKKYDCSVLKGKTILYSHEAEISMGGPTLKIQNQVVGRGSLMGMYALEHGYTMGLRETRKYSLPLPSGEAKFERSLYIEYIRPADPGEAKKKDDPEAVKKARKLLEAESTKIWRLAHPTIRKVAEFMYSGYSETKDGYLIRYTYLWSKGDSEHETTLGFRFSSLGTLWEVELEDIIVPMADSSEVAPFTAANLAAGIIKREIKKRIKKLKLPADDLLVSLVAKKLNAKDLAALWLKYREKHPE